MTERYEVGYIEAIAPTIDPLRLRGALNTLTGKQRFVVELRFGIRDGVAYTLEEVAGLMGVTHWAVMKLERKGLENLRRSVGVTENAP